MNILIRSLSLLLMLGSLLSLPAQEFLASAMIPANPSAMPPILVHIDTRMEDAWELTGNISLGSTSWNTVDDKVEMQIMEPASEQEMQLLAALEEFEAPEVGLAHFTAVCSDAHVVIDWEAAETEVIKYFVQRSDDGMSWQDVGMLTSSTEDAPLNAYVYVDNQPLVGSNYYRLRQVKIDNASFYSDPVVVEVFEGGSHTTHLFPNPMLFGASIELDLEEEERVSIRLMDEDQHILATIFSQETSRGRHTIELDMEQLPAGSYQCMIEVGSSRSFRILEK